MKDKKDTVLQCRVAEEDLKNADILADFYHVSRSEIVRKLLKKEMEATLIERSKRNS